MTTARLLIGDVFDRMAEIPDGSIDLVLTSPPFLALRSYLPADHPDKAKEIGSEPTPAAFLDTLLALTAEWRRVLAPHGSICIELGDTYSGSGGAGGDYADGGLREGQAAFKGSAAVGRVGRVGLDRHPDGFSGRSSHGAGGGSGWPLAKSLCLIPELYRLGLVYGMNALTGQPSPAGQWRARNVVRWCRPNPPVGALGDKVRPATSDMVIACVSDRRYFDLDAIRTSPDEVKDQRRRHTNGPKQGADPAEVLSANYSEQVPSNAAGAPPLDHWWHEDEFDQDAWLIPTQPYSGSHYATWPAALCTKPIRSMVPQRVCTTCGEPSRRITKPSDDYEANRCKGDFLGKANDRENGLQGDRLNGRPNAEYVTTGWTDCGHDTWRTGVVLDPFAGSGTTLAVATGEGREAIGIDLDERNADLVEQRVGRMFLDIDYGPMGASL